MAARGGNKSVTKVAQLLGAEGFTPHVASEIKRYWMRRSGLTGRQQRHIKARREAVSEIMSRLSESDRLVVGKYIGLLQKMAFDSGLKIGLMTLVTECGERMDKDGELVVTRMAPAEVERAIAERRARGCERVRQKANCRCGHGFHLAVCKGTVPGPDGPEYCRCVRYEAVKI